MAHIGGEASLVTMGLPADLTWKQIACGRFSLILKFIGKPKPMHTYTHICTHMCVDMYTLYM